MKFSIYNKIITAGLLLVSAFLSFSCQNQSADVNKPTATQSVKAQTPTEAYKMLYAAVKEKNPGGVKNSISANTQGLAEFMAQQQKQPVEKIFENGFTGTTFSPALPEIRDERIKDNFGALEVFNSKDNTWEDLPFVYEDGGWKLAVGDVFKNTYTSPGKGEAELEREASGNNMMAVPDANTSANKMNRMPQDRNAKK